MTPDTAAREARGRTRPRVAADAVAVTDRRAFTRAVTAPVVPAKAWARLEELDGLLEQVNALYAQAEQEIARGREEAQAAGFAEGLARAQQQMTEKLAALNERRARVLGGVDHRGSLLSGRVAAATRFIAVCSDACCHAHRTRRKEAPRPSFGRGASCLVVRGSVQLTQPGVRSS